MKAETQQFILNICKNIFQKWKKRKNYFYKSLYCEYYSDWLRAGRSGDRIPMGTRFSAPVQTGPGAHPASCKMVTGSFPGVESGLGVTLTPHPFLYRGLKTE
jgi:hypothetical protein